MEVYDLTGERMLLTKEEAEKIAATIVENASTLKKVILKTKTYKADVARIIGGLDTVSFLICRSVSPSQGCGRIGFIGYDFGSLI